MTSRTVTLIGKERDVAGRERPAPENRPEADLPRELEDSGIERRNSRRGIFAFVEPT